MEVIYFTSSIANPFLSEAILNDFSVKPKIIPIELWEVELPNISRGTLILIDHREPRSISEEIVFTINSKMAGLVTCIILADKMDFVTRINYYNLGVSAILQKSETLGQELQQYFIYAWKEYQIINGMKNMRIAVIDDSVFSLQVIKSYFQRIDAKNVDYYRDVKEILKRIDEYEMFLIDLVLPKFSGQELANMIKKEKQGAIVVIMTAYGESVSISQNENIGADDFLIKPFDFKVFILRLIACIRNRMLRTEKEKSDERLYELATKDTLTNVYNRRYFVDFLNQQIKKCIESEVQFSLILLDLDHFKNINDEYGHLVGDEVLKEIALLLKKNLREADIVCRWGGEEFIIFLLNTKIDAAGMIAEKLRNYIEQMKIEGVSSVTASFGATQWIEGDDATSIFKRIDNSLYLAKLTGRNKVVSNEEVFIYKGGLPVSIEWGPFFKSGHVQIDQEHNELISLSNELIINCFKEDNNEVILQSFDKLMNHIVVHFSNEEEILRDHAYKDYQEHKEIHSALIDRTALLLNQLKEGDQGAIDIAKYIIQEIVVGHIIKSDFKFFELFRS